MNFRLLENLYYDLLFYVDTCVDDVGVSAFIFTNNDIKEINNLFSGIIQLYSQNTWDLRVKFLDKSRVKEVLTYLKMLGVGKEGDIEYEL